MTGLFLDNDVISKLASCNLLTEAVSALGCHEDSVLILRSFKHRFGMTNETLRARRERELGVDTVARISAFQAGVAEIPPARDELILLLEDVLAIDPGEAQLFASASDDTNIVVVTGDKRSIRALHASVACVPIVKSLAARILCLEQVIKEAIRRFGFDYVKRRVVPGVGCDIALRAAFGMGFDAEEQQVLHALDGYIEELRQATGDLLRRETP